MEQVTFISFKPYLSVIFSKNGSMGVHFDENCSFTTSNPILIKLLRQYAEEHKNSYNIVEAEKGVNAEELSRLHIEVEDKELAQAEKRALARQEQEAEKQKEQDLIDALKSRF